MVGVYVLMMNDTPMDHPDLEPIWRAADELGLAVIYHSNYSGPPHYPGCNDLWGNAFLGGPRPTPGAPCGQSGPSSAAAPWTGTNRCGSASWKAAAAGCRSGAGGLMTKWRMSAGFPSSNARSASI